jgi:hypothetical protein
MSTYYFIKSNLSGNVIDIANASTKSGASLDSYPQKTTGTDNQLWEFIADPAGSGYYFIKSKLNGDVIDIANASKASGASLDSYPQKTTGTDNQLWEFVVDPAGSGFYFIKSKLNGNVIDIANASKASGALLDSWPQKTTAYENQLWGVVGTAGFYVLPPPQPDIAGSQSLVSASGGAVYGFVIGWGSGHVYEWAASGGAWYDLGTPPGSQATCLAALYPAILSGPLAFVIGSNGHLYDVLFSFAAGANPLFAWNDHGAIPASVTPSGAAVNVVGGAAGNPAMVSTVYQSTTSEIFAFVIGYDQNLYDCHLAGTDWVWEAHGAPAGTSLYLSGSPVGAVYDSATDQIFVFVLTENGHLWDRHGSGVTWEWYDHGVPAGSPKLNFYPCVVFQPSSGQIFAFVTASNGHVYCSNWTGTEWLWSDLGTPPSTSAGQAVAAVCDPSSDQISVFVVGGGHLYLNQGKGTTWGGWQDTLFSSALGASALGTPGYFSVVSPLTVLANLATGFFPLATGYFAEKTKKWVWVSVGLPTPS